MKYLISKGIDPGRVVSVGMGESQPFEMPATGKGKGSSEFPAGTVFSESNIKKMQPQQQELANELNRRTDFKVIRDDFAPPVDAEELAEQKAEAAKEEVAKLIKGEFYTVGEKETFATVCRAAAITITDLRRINGGLRGVSLVPGMVLKTTAKGDYTEFDASHRQVALGETWKSMASALKMKEKELKELNPEWSKVEPPVGTYVRTK